MDLQPASDGELLHRYCSAGDRAALGSFFERHRSLAYRVALWVLTSPADAEDAVQDAFLNLLAYAPRVRGEQALGSLVARMALRSAQRLSRSAGRRRVRESAWALDRPGEAAGAFEDLARREAALAVREAVESLDDAYRLPVVLHYLEGLSTQETASALGISHSATRTRISRALGKLRTRLGKDSRVAALPAALLLLRPGEADAAPASLAARLQQLADTPPPAGAPAPLPAGGVLKVKLAAGVLAGALLVGGMTSRQRGRPISPAVGRPSQAVAVPVAARLPTEPPAVAGAAPAESIPSARAAAPPGRRTTSGRAAEGRRNTERPLRAAGAVTRSPAAETILQKGPPPTARERNHAMIRKSASVVLLAAGLALHASAAQPAKVQATPAVEAPTPPDTPEALKGFRGVLVGTISTKKESSFVLKVEQIAKKYPRNEAQNPEAAIGQTALLTLSAKVRPAVEVEKMVKTLAGLPVGARVRVGVITVRGDLIAVEELAEVPAEK